MDGGGKGGRQATAEGEGRHGGKIHGRDKREMQPPDPTSGKMQQQPVVWRRELEGRTAAGQEEEEGKMLPRLMLCA